MSLRGRGRRHLPNGGVLLATHPYRTLWALQADALFLLGLRGRDEDEGAL